MLNSWRIVQGTDDGCAEFQCLKCYATWEGRTSPGYGWKYCPYCATEWEGQHECREHGEPKVEIPWDRRPYPPAETHAWAIMYREPDRKIKIDQPEWRLEQKYSLKHTAYQMHEILKETREREEERWKEILEEKDEWLMQWGKKEFKIIKTEIGKNEYGVIGKYW